MEARLPAPPTPAIDLVRIFHDDELRRECANEGRLGTAFTDCDLLAGSSAVGIGTAEGLRPLSSVGDEPVGGHCADLPSMGDSCGDDPRRFIVGAFMPKTSCELVPQLNVVGEVGDISRYFVTSVEIFYGEY
jgi:hypothetical protein